MRNGVAPSGRIPANPAARIAAATRSSGRRNLWVRRASRKPRGVTPLDEGSIDRLPRELGREDSNLQLPKSRGPGAPHRTKPEPNRRTPSGKPTPKPSPNRHRHPRLEDVSDAQLHLPPRCQVRSLAKPGE